MKLWILAGFAGILVGWYSWARYRQHQLAKARSGRGFEEFAGYFPAERYPRDKLRVVYEYFQGLQWVKNFPVDPNDDLSDVYGLADEDLDDAVFELAERYGKKSPTDADIEGQPPVRTVADVVRLLSRLPENTD